MMTTRTVTEAAHCGGKQLEDVTDVAHLGGKQVKPVTDAAHGGKTTRPCDRNCDGRQHVMARHYKNS